MESRDKTRSLVRMRRVVQKKVGLRSTGSTSIEESENFLEGILRVLLRARRLLATSYGIGFLIPDEKKEVRDAHETIQVSGSLPPLLFNPLPVIITRLFRYSKLFNSYPPSSPNSTHVYLTNVSLFLHLSSSPILSLPCPLRVN